MWLIPRSLCHRDARLQRLSQWEDDTSKQQSDYYQQGVPSVARLLGRGWRTNQYSSWDFCTIFIRALDLHAGPCGEKEEGEVVFKKMKKLHLDNRCQLPLLPLVFLSNVQNWRARDLGTVQKINLRVLPTRHHRDMDQGERPAQRPGYHRIRLSYQTGQILRGERRGGVWCESQIL